MYLPTRGHRDRHGECTQYNLQAYLIYIYIHTYTYIYYSQKDIHIHSYTYISMFIRGLRIGSWFLFMIQEQVHLLEDQLGMPSRDIGFVA